MRPTRMQTNDPQGAPDNGLLAGALAFLTGEGRDRSPERLLTGLYERFADAGQQKLADLVYEMCKARLNVLPDAAVRGFQAIIPRKPRDITRDMQVMRESMQGVSDPVSLAPADAQLPISDAAQVLDDIERCVAVLASLEGASTRHQLILGALHCLRGEPERAEPMFQALLDDPDLDEGMKRYAHVNLAFSLHRQDRSAEALEVAEQALQLYPDRETLHFTAIGSAADLGDREHFELAVARLFALQQKHPKELIKSWIAHDLDRVARRVGLTDEEIALLVAGSDTQESES